LTMALLLRHCHAVLHLPPIVSVGCGALAPKERAATMATVVGLLKESGHPAAAAVATQPAIGDGRPSWGVMLLDTTEAGLAGASNTFVREGAPQTIPNPAGWVRTTWLGRNRLVKATNHLASSHQAL
jgi:hypothetical protein